MSGSRFADEHLEKGNILLMRMGERSWKGERIEGKRKDDLTMSKEKAFKFTEKAAADSAQADIEEIRDKAVCEALGGGRDLEATVCSLGYAMVKAYYPQYLDRCFGKYGK